MTLPRACRQLFRAAAIDRAVGFTLLARVWLSIAGIVTLLLVGSFLSGPEQGYFYTFGGLLALQVFVELGLENVILQFASHERAHLELTSRGTLDGPARAKSRLASLVRLALGWYGAAAVILVAILLPAGFAFFTRFGSAEEAVAWQLPWIVTVLCTAGILLVTPVLALLGGCGFVAEIARFRLIQAIAANAALWLSLLLGARLAAASVFALTNLIMAVVWLTTSKRALLVDLLKETVREKIDWRNEAWPYQWRIAVSWLSGYCIFQLFTPVLFAFDGPVEAGRMGMALTLAGAVSALGLSWLTTKAPQFGALVSLRRLKELDAIFLHSVKRATAVSAVGGGLVMVLAVLLNSIDHPLADRIIGPLPLALLVLATVTNVVVAAEAIYLRAFKREPFLVVAILNAILVTSSTYFLGRAFGALGMMLGYFLVSLVGAGFGTWIFFDRRRAWHAEFQARVERQPPMAASRPSAA